jgi:Holliday junction resolvasome RuvABC endonuclease subunit
MIILGIDPSLTSTGYAYLESDSLELLSAGRLVPNKKDSVINRVGDLVLAVKALLLDPVPEGVVIEIPEGHVHRKKRKEMGGRGLTVYGFAAGAIWATLVTINQCPTYTVDQNDWTGGKSKASRQNVIACLYETYREIMYKNGDPGGDVSDAIALVLWLIPRLPSEKDDGKKEERQYKDPTKPAGRRGNGQAR